MMRVGAVENAFSAFSKDLVGAFCASTGPAVPTRISSSPTRQPARYGCRRSSKRPPRTRCDVNSVRTVLRLYMSGLRSEARGATISASSATDGSFPRHAPRPVRNPVRHRRRRHGRGLSRARHEAGSRRRDQDPARARSPPIRSGSRGFSARRRTLASLNHPNIAAHPRSRRSLRLGQARSRW